MEGGGGGGGGAGSTESYVVWATAVMAAFSPSSLKPRDASNFEASFAERCNGKKRAWEVFSIKDDLETRREKGGKMKKEKEICEG